MHLDKILLNEKRVRWLLKENGLVATRMGHKTNRTLQRSKPRAEGPRQHWGIDEIYDSCSGVGLSGECIGLVDETIVGWVFSLRSRSRERRRASEVAIQREFPHGVRSRGLKLLIDSGSQSTLVSFMRDMTTLGIE